VHPNLRVLGSRLNLEFDKGAVTEADVWNRGRVQEKPDLPEAFHVRRTHKFDGESEGPYLPPEIFFWLAEMQFPADLRGSS